MDHSLAGNAPATLATLGIRVAASTITQDRRQSTKQGLQLIFFYLAIKTIMVICEAPAASGAVAAAAAAAAAASAPIGLWVAVDSAQLLAREVSYPAYHTR
jgi:hypothetical protein